ncbi:MAG: molecular chaperone HtpG, partial [Woeseiaceae bacterium]|nr:molecular chaperone HtpG [Woeseiaceae bacterium]
ASFIVADKVTVETRRAGLAADEAVRWESDGKGEFSVESIERAARGTSVTLHLKEEQTEFTEPFRIESLIRKYSDHIGFPVTLQGDDSDGDEGKDKVVNSATALWTRPRTDVTDDEYKEFYKYLTHDFADPLAWSHNRVEGKSEYTSMLYIPAAAPFDLWNRDAPRGLKLYVQRVFIMDEAEQFLPLYLRFVKGIVDSSDLPLNVSRELLQQNPQLVTMRGALTRRVLGMLEKMASNEPDNYQTVWREFGQVLKEGVVEDHANKDKIAPLLRFASTEGESDAQERSLEDYVTRAAADQSKIYYLLAENHAMAASSPHLEELRKRGIEVLLLTDRIDPWLVDSLTEYQGKTLVDVAKSALDLPESDKEDVAEGSKKEHESLLEKVKKALGDRVSAVNVSQRLVDSPACVVAAEDDLNPQLRRMLEGSGQAMPESRPILEINVQHPLINRLSGEQDELRFSDLSHIVMDHALLAEGSSLEKPAEYVRRMNKLMLDISSGATDEK